MTVPDAVREAGSDSVGYRCPKKSAGDVGQQGGGATNQRNADNVGGFGGAFSGLDTEDQWVWRYAVGSSGGVSATWGFKEIRIGATLQEHASLAGRRAGDANQAAQSVAENAAPSRAQILVAGNGLLRKPNKLIPDDREMIERGNAGGLGKESRIWYCVWHRKRSTQDVLVKQLTTFAICRVAKTLSRLQVLLQSEHSQARGATFGKVAKVAHRIGQACGEAAADARIGYRWWDGRLMECSTFAAIDAWSVVFYRGSPVYRVCC